jgi:hypothetical protein
MPVFPAHGRASPIGRCEMPSNSEVLIGMLTENTGRHFLDSGGSGGRHWQRNQGRNFADEPAATLVVTEHGFSVTRSLYHYLDERLGSYDEDLTDSFMQYVDSADEDGVELESWDAYLPGFCKAMANKAGCEYTPTGDGHLRGDYTYNMDNLLDQDFQFTTFEDIPSGEWFVFLQIHGGCDARGGFTKPKIFAMYEPEDIYSDSTVTITTKNPIMNENQMRLDGSLPFWEDLHPPIYTTDDYPVDMPTFVHVEDMTPDIVGNVVYYDDNGNGYARIHGELFVLEVV